MDELSEQAEKISLLVVSSTVELEKSMKEFLVEMEKVNKKYEKKQSEDPIIKKALSEMEKGIPLYIIRYGLAMAAPGSEIEKECLKLGNSIIENIDDVNKQRIIIVRQWLKAMSDIYRKALLELPISYDEKLDFSEVVPGDFE